MTTLKITDTDILDDIIRQLEQDDTDLKGRAYAHYEDSEGVYIDASVRWKVESYSNYIDGYLEGIYTEVTGWEDLEVEAWVGDDPAEVDEDYICKRLDKGF